MLFVTTKKGLGYKFVIAGLLNN